MNLPNIVLAFALVFSGAIYAEQTSTEIKPDLNELASQLQLDAPKTRQLRIIMESHHQQMESARKQKQKIHTIREQHRVELLTVLNYEQLYKFEQFMRMHHQARKRHGQDY